MASPNPIVARKCNPTNVLGKQNTRNIVQTVLITAIIFVFTFIALIRFHETLKQKLIAFLKLNLVD